MKIRVYGFHYCRCSAEARVVTAVWLSGEAQQRAQLISKFGFDESQNNTRCAHNARVRIIFHSMKSTLIVETLKSVSFRGTSQLLIHYNYRTGAHTTHCSTCWRHICFASVLSWRRFSLQNGISNCEKANARHISPKTRAPFPILSQNLSCGGRGLHKFLATQPRFIRNNFIWKIVIANLIKRKALQRTNARTHKRHGRRDHVPRYI